MISTLNKIALLILLLFSASYVLAQNIVGEWVIDAQMLIGTNDTIIGYSRNNPNSRVDLSNIRLNYNIDNTMTATSLNGSPLSGTWDVTDGMMSIDNGQSFIFNQPNNDEFYTIKDIKVPSTANIGAFETKTLVTKMIKTSALPVMLVTFQGHIKDKTVFLNWISNKEKNYQLFEVEHGIDSKNYQKIGQVDGQKESYNFIHKSPKKGMNYYRLKQIGFDGKAEYSRIISLNLNLPSIEISPNPSTTEINIKTSENLTDIQKIEILSITGKKIREINTPSEKIDISDLKKGLYIILIKINEKDFRMKKFTKI